MMTQAAITKLQGESKPRLCHVAPCLYIRIQPNGGKTWVLRLVQNGRRIDRGLGSFPFVGIEEAKRLAREQHAGVKVGEPVPTKKEKKVVTFKQANEEYVELKVHQWKNPERTEREWEASMETHIYPKLGNMPIESITSHDIEKLLVPLYQRIPQMAIIMRKRLNMVMKRAVAVGYRLNNPVPAILEYVTEKKGEHFKAPHHSEVQGIIQTIQESTRVQPMTKLLLQLIIYTACRPGEARNATWEDIDFESKRWNRPAAKMKAKKAHAIPLSDEAVEVLKQAYASIMPQNASQSIFTIASTGTLSKALKRLGVESVAHGFRTSFRSWCAETGVSREVAEKCLSHEAGSIEKAYQRSDLIVKRGEVMQRWADYLEGKERKIARIA